MQMRLRAMALSLAAAVAVLAAHPGCGPSVLRSSDEIGSAARPESSPLRVLATGDARGYFEPCGCSRDQFGGVPRRATYLAAARGAGDLLIDVGNLTAGDGPLRTAKRRASLEALAAMKYDVFVPGPAEVFDGDAFLTDLGKRDLVAVCANWHRTGGSLVLPPWKLHRTADGRTVAVVGLTAMERQPPDGFHTTRPDDALRAALRELRGKADAVVVAAAMPHPDVQHLAAAAAGASLLVGGCTPEADGDAKDAPPPAAPLEVAGDLGAFVTVIDLSGDLSFGGSRKVWLDEGTPEDEALAAVVRKYKETVSNLDPGYIDRLIEGHRAKGFAGSHACAACHSKEYAVWKQSRHSHAMLTLEAKQADRDPECVPCHLVDLPPAPSVRANDLGLGCEMCHGGSAAHAESARAGDAEPIKTPVRAPQEACTSCHRAPFAKEFDLATHWPRIAHGK
ncbi:MAG: hypothetical protein HMLKMBBP_02471 [Planctomycetes bacterium]|nr:hypothetical protein [Planctomycetota bacterium]